MNRRDFLKSTAAALPLLELGNFETRGAFWKGTTKRRFRRVRPGDPGWPSEANWQQLKNEVEGRLLKLESPWEKLRRASISESAEFFRRLKNPYLIGDDPALTQTSGWVGAWTSRPSAYAVAAAKTEDVISAVNFAREKNLRLVVKGGGHSYQGTSSSADSLLVWTRALNSIVIHDQFIPEGCDGGIKSQPAVSAGAGCIWKHVYDAVTTKAGRYVQGGGCSTVGVAGLIQSGGFGSFSKHYGLAAAGLLEAEVVTANGEALVVNECQNADLFWALKGGGGGSLGIVTRVTLRTRELPEYFGGIFGTIKANTNAAFRALIARTMEFYREHLFNPRWGEQIRFGQGNVMEISMVFLGMNREKAEEIWQPLIEWMRASPNDYIFEKPIRVVDIPARHFWDATYMKQNFAQAIVADDRPGAPEENVFWSGDRGQVGHVLHGYRSAWLPAGLLHDANQKKLVDAIFKATRDWGVGLHFNKGLAGAPEEEIAAARDTATNPAVLDAFALAIIAANEQPAYPGIPGHEPDAKSARRHASAIDKSMNALLKVVPKPGSYVSESDFFERSWQRSFWGSNYDRLLTVKSKYDPDGLFFVHHGVGTENWNDDGFERIR